MCLLLPIYCEEHSKDFQWFTGSNLEQEADPGARLFLLKWVLTYSRLALNLLCSQG